MTVDSRTLPAAADSVPKARRFVRERVLALGAHGACDDAETLVSELATNAVLHAKTDYTITISRTGDTIRVRVFDLSTVLPRERHYGPDSTTGRGIRLIASLATDWGVEPEGAGKAVWFELPVDGTNPNTLRADTADLDVEQLLGVYDDVDDGRTDVRAQSMAMAA